MAASGHSSLLARGIAALEDKIVQHAVVQVLNQIWEEDFLDFSYLFRPARSQHDALDALYVGINRRKVNYVLDLDIRSFFDKVGHDHLERLVRHRIGDERVVRLILKWMKAGVMEDGQWFETKEGTPDQGRRCIAHLVTGSGRHVVFVVGPSGHFAAACQSLPALRARSVGSGMAEESGARRCNRGAVWR